MPKINTPPCTLARAGARLIACVSIGWSLVTSALARPPEASTALPLGTLFYSPAERQTIEGQRRGEVPASAASPSTPASSERIEFSGQVRRAQGKGTVWINGQPVAQGQAGALRQTPTLTPHGIRIDEQSLRVGESIDLSSQQRSDIVPPGAVAKKRAP